MKTRLACLVLSANGVKVPERVPQGRTGNSNFTVKDPDGHTVEFVQYEPDGMKVPNGDDHIELMLYSELSAPGTRGTQNHLCLEVADVEKAKALLDGRPSRQSYARAIGIRTGINRKRQLNLYDPDGTRSELMEPGTVDGRPVAPSTAPPPR